MSRYRPHRNLPLLFLVAGAIWLAASAAAATGSRAGRAWGTSLSIGSSGGAASAPRAERRPSGSLATSGEARPARAGLAAQLWHWLAGIWEKEGATSDPEGQPQANSAAGCPAQGEAGALIDPDGRCGAL